MTPEFHRLLSLDRIGPNGLDLTIEATAAESAALAVRMNVPAVLAMSCTFHLIREGRDSVLARGALRAEVTQTCVISLEEFDSPVEEVFRSASSRWARNRTISILRRTTKSPSRAIISILARPRPNNSDWLCRPILGCRVWKCRRSRTNWSCIRSPHCAG